MDDEYTHDEAVQIIEEHYLEYAVVKSPLGQAWCAMTTQHTRSTTKLMVPFDRGSISLTWCTLCGKRL
jgi:hypothetical protein